MNNSNNRNYANRNDHGRDYYSMNKDSRSNERDHPDLTKRYLSMEELHRAASNLNAIENERELQNVHSNLDYIFMMLTQIAAVPFILYLAYGFLCSSDNVFQFIFIIIAAIIAISLDVFMLRGTWQLFVWNDVDK